MPGRPVPPAVFPKRLPSQTDGVLRKELIARGIAQEEVTILTRSEYNILRDLISGKAFTPYYNNSAGVATVSSAAVAVDESAAAAALSESERRQIAEERKRKMMAFDNDRREKGYADAASMEELEKAAAKAAELQAARRKQDENIDEVKRMNQVMLYAKCVTVRDAQVLEKKAIKAEKSEEERRVDMAMELERLKALRMYEEREVKRIEDRKKGAAVICAQIEEREQERLRKLELKQQEQEAMLRHIERMREEDLKETLKKKDASRRLMEDVALANAEQIRLKSRQHEMEQEEERQIAEYIREKQLREQAQVEEQIKLKAEKEKEIARLRSLQEKAQDKQAEMDALRARRAQEAYDREWRTKEREASVRQQAINEDLSKAREQQKVEKENMLRDQARFEKEEFERVIAVQKSAEEQERLRQIRDKDLRERNAAEIKKQIVDIEENRRKARRDFLEEGNKLKTEKRERDSTIEAIRNRKLEELERLEVPKQYRSELLKKRPTEPLRPAV
jgi:hypothetical protein